MIRFVFGCLFIALAVMVNDIAPFQAWSFWVSMIFTAIAISLFFGIV